MTPEPRALKTERESMEQVNNFDVLKEMSLRNLRIALGLDVLGVRKTKAGTVIEVGIGGDFIGDIASGRMAAVLLVWDRGQYNTVRDELVRAPQGKTEGREADK